MANEIQPISRDPNGPRGTFYYGDIWLGTEPPLGHVGRFVTKEDDIVYKFEGNGTKVDYRVTYVDGNGIPTLAELKATSELGGDEEDVFRGSDLATDEDILRCFINSDVLPMELSIDGRLLVHGDDISHFKVFKGLDYDSPSAVIISAMYNTSGQITSTDIPMLTPSNAIAGEYVGKVPGPGYSTHALLTGDIVTVIIYKNDERVARIRRMQVENTNFVRSVANNKKLVTDIRLVSPYLSPTDATVLEYPVNITMDTAQLFGRVTYTNGVETLPIDGGRFSLLGFNNSVFTSATEGQEITLSYQMAQDEEAFGIAGITENRKIMKNYRIRGVEYPGAYNVKLFVYPEWVDAVTGYRLRAWLHNIDRATYTDVTGYLQLTENSEPFRSKTYGVLQNLRLALDLRAIDSNYREIRHLQTIGIVLNAAGSSSSVPRWRVFYHETQSPAFGIQGIARIQHVTSNTYTLNLSSNYTTQATWLKGLYFDSFPLIGGQEAAPPLPTNFTVELPNGTFDYSISQWNAILNMTGTFAQGRLVVIHFWRAIGSERVYLSTAALPVHLV